MVVPTATDNWQYCQLLILRSLDTVLLKGGHSICGTIVPVDGCYFVSLW